MVDKPVDDASAPDRRATWVGLRTLRQRPRSRGQTADGLPVFEVSSVRVVLRPEAAQFNRLLECSNCGADVVGRRIFTPADLDHAPNQVLCSNCVKRGTPPAPAPKPWVARVPRAPGPAPTSRARPPAEVRPPAAVEKPAAPKPAAVEKPVTPAPVQAAAPVEAAGGANRLAAMTAMAAPAEAEARAIEFERRLKVLAAGLATVAAAGEAKARAIEAEAQTREASLVELLRAQGHELETLSGVVAELRGELEQVGTWRGLLAEAQHAFDGHLSDLARRMQAQDAAIDERVDALTASADAEAARLHVLEERLQASVRRMTRLVGVQGRHRPVGGVDGDRPPPAPTTALLDELERQLREAEGRLARRSAGGDGAA